MVTDDDDDHGPAMNEVDHNVEIFSLNIGYYYILWFNSGKTIIMPFR